MPEQAHHSYYKYAFLSAFTTLPSFQPSREFFKKDVEPIFNNFRDALSSMQARSKNDLNVTSNADDPFLYRPVPYCLFGDFDMAIFSLIDDFSFATKTFKPAPSSMGFKYQVNTGIIPLVEAYDAGNPGMPPFRDTTLPQFFTGADFYPFTGIASVKLNNAMLVGTGQRFLDMINFFLITFLDEKIKESEKGGRKLFYILNENLGWNEVTIYFFGTSMYDMQEMIMELRQFRLRDIESHFQSLLATTEYDKKSLNDFILPVFSQLKDDSLLGFWINKSGNQNEYLESHPVIATSMAYGFHIDCIELSKNKKAFRERCQLSDDNFKLFLQQIKGQKTISVGWKVKPGHEKAAERMVSEFFPGFPGSLLKQSRTGKYPFMFPQRKISLKEYLDFSAIIESWSPKKISRDIIKLRSRIDWVSGVKYKDFDDDLHYDYDLQAYRIKPDEIINIQNQLRTHPIPHVYKSQIENLMINYNDAISDPLMYNYFIGLKAPLLNFLRDKFYVRSGEEKKEEESIPPPELLEHASADRQNISRNNEPPDNLLVDSVDAETISAFIQAWNKAYWNRYFHSYYFTEINDFNIEHHGGIQQLLFTYDIIYKLITRRIYGTDSKVPFVNVQVSHYINSTQYFNTINFTHLFRPAIYASECVHEAANHIIPYLIQQNERKEFSFLFDPRTEKVEADKIPELLEFERNLYARVGPREKFEMDYLDVHFGFNAVRQVVADYATYVLGYNDPSQMGTKTVLKKDIPNATIFYQTHWFLFLIRADLYYREMTFPGGWFFKVDDFTALFIRFNLMFHLFFDFEKQDLLDLNRDCPSVELKALWEGKKVELIDLTLRLGTALREEFTRQLEKQNISLVNGEDGFSRFRSVVQLDVVDKNWEQFAEKQDYQEVIRINQQLIKGFHAIFTHENQYNIIIRKSENSETIPICNIDFFKPAQHRELFLDPKGNLFTTSPASRRKIFEKNVDYLKSIWDLSLKIAIRDY